MSARPATGSSPARADTATEFRDASCRFMILASSLVPKLRLGTHVRKLRFPSTLSEPVDEQTDFSNPHHAVGRIGAAVRRQFICAINSRTDTVALRSHRGEARPLGRTFH